MKRNYEEYVSIFKSLADETRLKIVEMLSCGEMCACDILEYFHFTQPTLSYHMKQLTDSGLVTARKDGSWMKYSLNNESFEMMSTVLSEICKPSEECICHNLKNTNKE